MKIKVYVVDTEVSHSTKRALIRIGGPLALLLAFGSIVDAAPPHAFTNGETLTAANLMADFNDLDTRVSKLETKIVVTTNGKQYSLGATYCGATASFNGQITNGYAGAKALCEAVSTGCNSSPSAHMCTAEELVRSAQTGWTPSFGDSYGWFSSGVHCEVTTSSIVPVHDCAGWTNNGSSVRGAAWSASPSEPYDDNCNASHPVLCCD